jgi:hypothetical protein
MTLLLEARYVNHIVTLNKQQLPCRRLGSCSGDVVEPLSVELQFHCLIVMGRLLSAAL